MKTGEGKTLAAAFPAYLNALTGKGVHVVTVNDYLARYQSDLMGRVYRFVGMETGVILNGLTPAQRREAYAADITYGTNNEFGFDYLRDNMAQQPAEPGAARALLRHRRRGRLDPHRRGPHPAHHLRPGRAAAEVVHRSSPASPPAWSATSTTRWTRRSAPSASPRRASPSSRTTWAWRTSTSRRTPRSSGSSTTPSRPRSCTAATRTTSSSTARSTSSTSTPAACWPGAATPRACTRPSRPRRACRSSARTRRWPRSRCRTTSACTTSSAA